MARTKWLKIRVSDQEIADIKKRIGSHDMSNYVRKLVLGQPIAPPEPKHKKSSIVPIPNWCEPLIGLVSISIKSPSKLIQGKKSVMPY